MAPRREGLLFWNPYTYVANVYLLELPRELGDVHLEELLVAFSRELLCGVVSSEHFAAQVRRKDPDSLARVNFCAVAAVLIIAYSPSFPVPTIRVSAIA